MQKIIDRLATIIGVTVLFLVTKKMHLSPSGMVQKPASQVSQKAAQPAKGAAPEAEGGVRNHRGLHRGHQGRADARRRHPRYPAASLFRLLLPLRVRQAAGGGGKVSRTRRDQRGGERHLPRAIGRRVGGRGQRGRGGGQSEGGGERKEQGGGARAWGDPPRWQLAVLQATQPDIRYE